jgi:macrolide transport system ATP-binding/permease protein
MKALRVWTLRLAGLFAKQRRERELAEEFESHLQLQFEDNLRAGMTREQARREAILKSGGIESAKEACRDRSTLPLIEQVFHDARFAIRQLRKSPGFACTAIFTLSVGLCASVALFAFVDAALIQPLPFPYPARLVHVTGSIAMMPRANVSYLDYLDWKKANRVFQSLDVFTGTGYLLRTSGGTEPVPALRVSDGFFRTLGVAPIIGRDFRPGEDLAGTPNIAIISYGAWQKRFGGAKDVVGRTIRLSGVPHTIVGVLPQTFQFAPRGEAEIWTTLHASGSCDLRRSCHNLEGIARLRDGVSIHAALGNMTSIAQQLEKEYPDSNRGQGVSVLPLSEVIVGDIRPILLVLLGGGMLLLLMGCVNVASLLLARSQSRRREIAVRSSLGASSSRLATQFVTEALVLIAAAGLVGLLLAEWAMKILSRLVPADMMARTPYLRDLGLNLHVLAFAGCLALLAALLFSAVPSLHLCFSEVRKGLAEGSRGSAGVAWRRLGARLVIIELAIAMVLLVGAGLLGKSLSHLLHVDLGFQPDHLATLQVAVPEAKYTKDEQTVAFGREILNRMEMLPGVKSAGIANILPVSGNGDTDWIRFVGRPFHGEHNEVNSREVTAGYFAALRPRLLRGRYFTDAEDASKPRVVIINQALARTYFFGRDPLGQRFGDIALSPKSIREVIGIVDDIRESSLDTEVWPTEYLPFNQCPETYFSLTVRTSQSERSLLPAMSAAVRQIDPDVGTVAETTMTERINSSPSAYLHRSSAWLVGAFAGLALLLGVIGLYGVVAYSVSQRTREIGIRMALGAQRSTVHRLILREAGWLTTGGLALGLVCSLVAAICLRRLLFGVSSWDVPTLAAVAAVLALAALLASHIPARRAASVNPVDALRSE